MKIKNVKIYTTEEIKSKGFGIVEKIGTIEIDCIFYELAKINEKLLNGDNKIIILNI